MPGDFMSKDKVFREVVPAVLLPVSFLWDKAPPQPGERLPENTNVTGIRR